MSRQHRNARLQTREARLKLPHRHEPYWYEVERGRSLGYHTGVHGGSWRLRERLADALARPRLVGVGGDRDHRPQQEAVRVEAGFRPGAAGQVDRPGQPGGTGADGEDDAAEVGFADACCAAGSGSLVKDPCNPQSSCTTGLMPPWFSRGTNRLWNTGGL